MAKKPHPDDPEFPAYILKKYERFSNSYLCESRKIEHLLCYSLRIDKQIAEYDAKYGKP